MDSKDNHMISGAASGLPGQSGRGPGQAGGPEAGRGAGPGPTLRAGGYRTAGFLGLAVLAIAFVTLSLPRYLAFDPARSRVELGTAVFPLLVGHVLFGSIAMLTALLQLWPTLRDRFPTVHPAVGRLYVYAGVLPAGVLALVVACYSPFGPVARASNLVFAAVWLGATLAGWRAVRRGDSCAHRRWMIRSTVLTFSILSNRLWGPLAFILLEPQLATTFHGDETFFAWTIAGLSTWLGWTLPLLITEILLEREIGSDRPTPLGEGQGRSRPRPAGC